MTMQGDKLTPKVDIPTREEVDRVSAANRLTPSEIASLKQAARSAYQNTREKFPNIRFAKP